MFFIFAFPGSLSSTVSPMLKGRKGDHEFHKLASIAAIKVSLMQSMMVSDKLYFKIDLGKYRNKINERS